MPRLLQQLLKTAVSAAAAPAEHTGRILMLGRRGVFRRPARPPPAGSRAPHRPLMSICGSLQARLRIEDVPGGARRRRTVGLATIGSRRHRRTKWPKCGGWRARWTAGGCTMRASPALAAWAACMARRRRRQPRPAMRGRGPKHLAPRSALFPPLKTPPPIEPPMAAIGARHASRAIIGGRAADAHSLFFAFEARRALAPVQCILSAGAPL